jgi:hypothetical protein
MDRKFRVFAVAGSPVVIDYFADRPRRKPRSAHAERVGRWLDERIDLSRVYAEIWKDTAPAHLVDIAVFCDSDDTHTTSISYFDYVRLERR